MFRSSKGVRRQSSMTDIEQHLVKEIAEELGLGHHVTAMTIHKDRLIIKTARKRAGYPSQYIHMTHLFNLTDPKCFDKIKAIDLS